MSVNTTSIFSFAPNSPDLRPEGQPPREGDESPSFIPLLDSPSRIINRDENERNGSESPVSSIAKDTGADQSPQNSPQQPEDVEKKLLKINLQKVPTTGRTRARSAAQPMIKPVEYLQRKAQNENQNAQSTDKNSSECKNDDSEATIFQDRQNNRQCSATQPPRMPVPRKRSFDNHEAGSLDKYSDTSTRDLTSPITPIDRKKHLSLANSANLLFKKISSPPKAPTVSLTFDAFVDKQKGEETIKTEYPTYKVDKRLIFLGKRLKYPTFVIGTKSLFRKRWNLLILVLILYEVLLYPLFVTFLAEVRFPRELVAIEWILFLVFLVDILINSRTTFCNQNNEEIIDRKMIRTHYIKSKYFFIDIISLIPIGEILDNSSFGFEDKAYIYTLPKLIRLIRLLKLKKYLQNLDFGIMFKLLKILIAFFLMVHWASCIWYLLIHFQFNGVDDPIAAWFPNNLRMSSGGDPDNLLGYYYEMGHGEKYGQTMLSVFMLAVGSDMAPVNLPQIYLSVIIGFMGALCTAYVVGLVSYTVSSRSEYENEYNKKLEALKQKLKINKVPVNLKAKVLEYFDYTWRKHRVLHKLNDFSELSIPLQRDLAFFQSQKMVASVPLFHELEPAEILSIIQKLKTSVYMPGDKIIREGERGSEMCFIQEGVVEIITKTGSQDGTPSDSATFKKTYLEKGSYFGEMALMSNSKRHSDVNAYEFCILECLSKADYQNLKKEFPDIGPRLKSGLNYYKIDHLNQIVPLIKGSPIFEGFAEDELKTIVTDYMEEVFIDPNRIVLRPKDKANSIYFLLLGSVNRYANDTKTREYLTNLKKAAQGQKVNIFDLEEEDEFACLDDDILDLEKDRVSMDDYKKKLELIKSYKTGEYFGNLDFGDNVTKNEQFYVSETGCQIGAITQAFIEDLKVEQPALYQKLKSNADKVFPKKAMVPIEEENESIMSVSMRHQGLRRPSKISKGTLLRLDNARGGVKTILNMEEDFVSLKDQLNIMQGDMEQYKLSLFEISNNLAKLVQQSHAKSPTNEIIRSIAEKKRPSLRLNIIKKQETCDNTPDFKKKSM